MEEPAKPRPNRFRKVLGYLPALIVFPILIGLLIENLGTLAAEDFRPDVWPLVLSLVLVLLHFILSGLGWGLFLYWLGRPIGAYQAVRISALSLLGRYVPGKVWTVLAKVHLAGRLGVPKSLALTASGYDFLFFNLGALTFFSLIWGTGPDQLPWSRVFLVLVPGILFLALFPNLITGAVNAALKLARREPLTARISRRAGFSGLLFYTGAWGVTSASFCFFVRAFLPQAPVVPLAAGLVLANVVGFAFILAPGGLGVREGVMALVLQTAGMPSGEAVLAALLCRVWSTAGEVLVVGPLWLYKGADRRDPEAASGEESK